MPDSILICILSQLPVKDAVKTSTLCHILRHLWKYISNLDFDGFEKMRSLHLSGVFDLQPEVTKYLSWVNRVIKSSLSPDLGLFRLCFHITCHHSDKIDRFLEFAADRGVRVLDLNLYTTGNSLELYLYASKFAPPPQYAFPSLRPSFVPRIKLLRSLCLREVGVNAEQLELLLSECRPLETVQVLGSMTLTDLMVAGDLPLRLKHLHISWCSPVFKGIELLAPTPDLEWFTYKGSASKSFHIESAPGLVHLSVSGDDNWELLTLFQPISHDSYQIQTLTITFREWSQVWAS